MIRVDQLQFEYPDGRFELRIDELSIESAGRVALVGPSGCGKTTFLHLVAGILSPSRGSLHVGSEELTALGEHERRRFRLQRIGLVFQEFELVEHLDVLDNIILPYRLGSALELDGAVRDRCASLATDLGIVDKLRRPVRKLSQGERQRVALCRALLPGPMLILADEPTGNLDPANADRVVELLLEGAAATGATLLVVTHDRRLESGFDRVLDLGSMHRRRDEERDRD